MNNVYLYNSSFESLLTLIFSLIDKEIKPDDIKSEYEYTPNLIDKFLYLKIDNKDEIFNKYNNKLTYPIIYSCYKVYLSNDERKELIIYYFIKNSLIYKNKIFDHRYLNCVLHTIRISKYVSEEAHKLKGFLRFKELKSGVLYAEMSPNNNVIFILAEHFKKRLMNEKFLIKDVNRGIYAFYDGKKIYYLNNDELINLKIDITNNEIEIENLWKTFFNTVGIKERENKKVQMNFMPKRYWKYIIEMENKL